MQTLVIASHNRKKAGEMVQILSARFPELELKTLADYDGAPEPEETGETYAGNARIKSESAAEFTGEWSLADDAGLEIDAMGGAPGLKSKRFEGEDTAFDVKIAKILELLKGVPEAGRAARFRCCIALTGPGGASTEVFEATCEGPHRRSSQWRGRLRLRPHLLLPELGRTMADLTAAEKHEVSHRGKVLRMLADHLATPP